MAPDSRVWIVAAGAHGVESRISRLLWQIVDKVLNNSLNINLDVLPGMP